MKKKSRKNIDVAQVMVQIQEQLAALDQKLETFITKSLTELAQALAAQKPAAPPRPVPPPPMMSRPPEQPRRPMFTVICFDCGKDCEIPFKPSAGRPVYCRECFARRKAGHTVKVSHAATLPPAPVAAIKTPESRAQGKKKAPAAKKSVIKKKTAAKKKK